MATKFEYYNTGDDSSRAMDVSPLLYVAQTFTPSVSHTITSMKFKVWRVGEPGTITVEIYATDEGKPSGSVLASGTTNGNTLTDSSPGEWREVSLGAGVLLEADVMYAMVGKIEAGRVPWGADASSPTYDGGTCLTWAMGWITRSTEDLMFEEWGDALTAPTVTTQAVTSISGTTATGNGNVTDLGDSAVTQHGHCWNTTGTPTTTADSKTTNGAKAATGAFTSSITGLTSSTKYYVRAYATNAGGTSYGEQVIFIAGAVGGELRGNYAVVEERFHYVDAYGVERYVEGTIV